MNTDIRLSTDFFANVKVKKLKKRLGADGVLALIALWAYCAKMYPDGELGKQADGDVELMADWEGEDGALESALIELGFLDVHDDGTLALHDWAENNPYVADSRARGDTQRLNRLGGQNPTAAKAARDAGLNGITKEQYYAIRHANSYEAAMSYLQNGEAVTPPSDKTETAVSLVNNELQTVDEEPLTTVERPSTTGTTPAPAPDPAPVPVPEPEIKNMGASTSGDRHTGATDYPPEFEAFWQAYPSARRLKKSGTFARWKGLVKAGVPPESLVIAAQNYAALCAREHRVPSRIMHSTTFLGSDRAWEDFAPGGSLAGPQPEEAGGAVRDYDEAREAFFGRFGSLREEMDCDG